VGWGHGAGWSVALELGAVQHGMWCAAGKTAAASARRNNTRLASMGVIDIFEIDGETQRESRLIGPVACRPGKRRADVRS